MKRVLIIVVFLCISILVHAQALIFYSTEVYNMQKLEKVQDCSFKLVLDTSTRKAMLFVGDALTYLDITDAYMDEETKGFLYVVRNKYGKEYQVVVLCNEKTNTATISIKELALLVFNAKCETL